MSVPAKQNTEWFQRITSTNLAHARIISAVSIRIEVRNGTKTDGADAFSVPPLLCSDVPGGLYPLKKIDKRLGLCNIPYTIYQIPVPIS